MSNVTASVSANDQTRTIPRDVSHCNHILIAPSLDGSSKQMCPIALLPGRGIRDGASENSANIMASLVTFFRNLQQGRYIGITTSSGIRKTLSSGSFSMVDFHQLLQVSFRKDRGGNSIVNVELYRGNLLNIWDVALVYAHKARIGAINWFGKMEQSARMMSSIG